MKRLASMIKASGVADMLALAGIACLAVAGFEIAPPLGWFVVGTALLLLALGLQREHK